MRPDLRVIAALVPEASRVLDLGCGEGDLLAHLARERGCEGLGVEIGDDLIVACIERGVPVLELDVDEGLADLEDGSFDVVVVSQTLQATRRPREVLREVLRVGRRAIVSIPNFGHWRHRAMLLGGHMPSSPTLPYAWYETPNIHLATLADFEQLVTSERLRVVLRIPLRMDGEMLARVGRAWPNLLAAGAAYVLERES